MARQTHRIDGGGQGVGRIDTGNQGVDMADFGGNAYVDGVSTGAQVSTGAKTRDDMTLFNTNDTAIRGVFRKASIARKKPPLLGDDKPLHTLTMGAGGGTGELTIR